MRRNSRINDDDGNINIDDQNSNCDVGGDAPTKLDSGRINTNTNSFGGSIYMGRGEAMHLPQNHMFDIEEDNEDLFENHQ